jgi:hypothetical protein
MMGRQRRDQGKLFYEFRLHKGLESFYSDIGRPSVDPS